jgi:hypothetical protein
VRSTRKRRVFEKIVLRHAPTKGEIAEALLFYRDVHLILDPHTLKPLLDSFGPYGLLGLIEQRPSLRVLRGRHVFGPQRRF